MDYADFGVGFLGDNAQAVGWIIFVLVTIFVVTAVSNGANLNDGMDGWQPEILLSSVLPWAYWHTYPATSNMQDTLISCIFPAVKNW